MDFLDVPHWTPIAQYIFAGITAIFVGLTGVAAWRRKNPPAVQPAASVVDEASILKLRSDFRDAIDDVRKDFEDAISAATKSFDIRFDGQTTMHQAAYTGLQTSHGAMQGRIHAIELDNREHDVKIVNLEREVFRHSARNNEDEHPPHHRPKP